MAWSGGRTRIALSASALVLFSLAFLPLLSPRPKKTGAEVLSGSTSCRSCHLPFYLGWSRSFHGLAMRLYTPEFARVALSPDETPLTIGGSRYRTAIGTASDRVLEDGPEGSKSYPIAFVLGGKDVFYFLTGRERGFLQVLPVAYDVRRREWFGTAKSAVRHFEGGGSEELPWTDRAYTFNTSCFSCHVSQLESRYEARSDSYRTTWSEPGVSCETCHGPGEEHIKALQEAGGGPPPKDLKILQAARLSKEQRNDLCASCHAKAMIVSVPFRPGDSFFDHYDLVGLESPDFSPDGRDVGENYTFTSWRMSPCVKSGELDCLHCHTSAGSLKFEARSNDACLPCHLDHVRNAPAHTHHPGDGGGTRCVDCHMPTTEFARMRRTDHSMRPPSPAAGAAFHTKDACTLCHADKGAAWAQEKVVSWGGGFWSKRMLREGRLVAAARKGDCSSLPDILGYMSEASRDEVVTASLARLLAPCADPAKWPVLRALAKDPSPLVRGAVLAELGRDRGARDLLLQATSDPVRLVRFRAAEVLEAVELERLPEGSRKAVKTAVEERERSLLSREDDYAAQYDLGNIAFERGDFKGASDRFKRALTLRGDHVESLVNLSLAEARLGDNGAAEKALREAVRRAPQEEAAYFNLGLLLAEGGRTKEAEAALTRALELSPRDAEAAYNLSVLLFPERPKEGVALAARAASLAPLEPKYAFTEALYRSRSGDVTKAEALLRTLVARHPSYREGWALLGTLLEGRGRTQEALDVYRKASSDEALTPEERQEFKERARRLSS